MQIQWVPHKQIWESVSETSPLCSFISSLYVPESSTAPWNKISSERKSAFIFIFGLIDFSLQILGSQEDNSTVQEQANTSILLKTVNSGLAENFFTTASVSWLSLNRSTIKRHHYGHAFALETIHWVRPELINMFQVNEDGSMRSSGSH